VSAGGRGGDRKSNSTGTSLKDLGNNAIDRDEGIKSLQLSGALNRDEGTKASKQSRENPSSRSRGSLPKSSRSTEAR
jgi:hypothetical protein